MTNNVLILLLEGADPVRLATVRSVSALADRGIDVQLTPLPIAEQDACAYQLLAGIGSGKSGRFDAVYPERYMAREATGVPEGIYGRMLPDLLRSRRLLVSAVKADVPAALRALDALTGTRYDLALVHIQLAQNDSDGALDDVVWHCVESLEPTTHLVVLTDVSAPAPAKLVNVNDFLAEVGLVDVRTPGDRSKVNWSETLAYGLGTGQIWVNVRGRETQGVVGFGSEYQQVRDALVEELSANWRDPETHEPVVAQVLTREEAYSGDYLFKAPDLVVVYRPGYAPSAKARSLDFDGVSVQGTGQSTHAGVSSPCARLIAAGPSLARGARETATLVDVMPNVLYLLGQPIPAYADGHVAPHLFSASYQQDTPVRYAANAADLLSEEQEGLVVNRLRDLGYLG